MSAEKKGFVSLLQEFSIPLIAGVFAALLAANLAPEWYAHWFGAHEEAWHIPGFKLFGEPVNIHYLVNDIFMVFFFGIAAKEITEACLPGGSLNPVRKALNPLFATAGGVLGPILVFYVALFAATRMDLFPERDWGELHRGWGIPTATDIALAWLVARAVFGKGHPAINFLLLLAVADDAIGLVIIAVFYGDPAHPAQPIFLLFVLAGMACAYALRRAKVKSWVPYIATGGPLAWVGLSMAHLHPALALVFIVPFLPGPKHDTGLFIEKDETDLDPAHHPTHSPLHNFEHQMKAFVDFGLFFFAMANAGVELGGIGPMTWIIFASLVIGKTAGVSLFATIANRMGFPLPNNMGKRELYMAGFVAALGLTVALFVSGAAFPTDAVLQSEAKMGALFSGFVGVVAIVLARAMGMGRATVPGGSSPDLEGSGAQPPSGQRPSKGTPSIDSDDVPSALPRASFAETTQNEQG